MRLAKVQPVVSTKPNDKCKLNKNIRLKHSQKKSMLRERDISQQNQRMFKRLYSIVSRTHPLKQKLDNKGPTTLNMINRKSELKRIMKSNKEILNNIQHVKPIVSILDLQKRFDKNEKYKDLARMYTENGKKEDPVEAKMRQFYNDESLSPKRQVNKILQEKPSFIPKSKRHKSIDAKCRPKESGPTNPYYYAQLRPGAKSCLKERSSLNRSTNLPKLSNVNDKFMSAQEYNNMVSNEMSMIRQLRKRSKGATKSVPNIPAA